MISRANGSDLGSFLDEGFQDGDLIEVRVAGTDYHSQAAGDGGGHGEGHGPCASG